MKKCRDVISTFYVDGYMTLEISLIMPFILFLLCNICFMAIFLYDNSTMNQGAYVTALIAERTLENQDKMGKATIKYEESVRSRLVGAIENSSINIGNKGVVVKSHISMETPAKWIYESFWNMVCEQKADRYEPVLYIRNIRNVKNVKNIEK